LAAAEILLSSSRRWRFWLLGLGYVEDTPKQVVKCGEIVVTVDVQTLHPGQKIRMVGGAS
jgi:hypothetical protein